MTYGIFPSKTLRTCAIVNMGTTLKATPKSPEHRAIVLDRLAGLSVTEMEICILHLIDGHPQTTVADWLGVTLRAVQMHLTHAVLKVPELRPLRTLARQKHTRPPRPRILQFSQLRGNEKGPFNPGET